MRCHATKIPGLNFALIFVDVTESTECVLAEFQATIDGQQLRIFGLPIARNWSAAFGLGCVSRNTVPVVGRNQRIEARKRMNAGICNALNLQNGLEIKFQCEGCVGDIRRNLAVGGMRIVQDSFQCAVRNRLEGIGNGEHFLRVIVNGDHGAIERGRW